MAAATPRGIPPRPSPTDIRLAIGNTAQVAAAIETRTAELGFVEGSVKSAQLVSAPIARDQLVLVVGPDHPWGRSSDLTARGLRDSEWVLREPGSGTRSVFEQALAKLGVDSGCLQITMELPSNEAVRAAVEAGLGATVLSASAAVPSIESGLLHHVPFRLPQREFHVLQHRQRYHSRIADACWPPSRRPRRYCPAVRDCRGRSNSGTAIARQTAMIDAALRSDQSLI